MNRLHTRLSTWTIALCMFFVLSGISAMASPQASSTDDQASTTTSKKKKKKTKKDAAHPPISRGRGHFGVHHHRQEKIDEDQESGIQRHRCGQL